MVQEKKREKHTRSPTPQKLTTLARENDSRLRVWLCYAELEHWHRSQKQALTMVALSERKEFFLFLFFFFNEEDSVPQHGFSALTVSHNAISTPCHNTVRPRPTTTRKRTSSCRRWKQLEELEQMLLILRASLIIADRAETGERQRSRVGARSAHYTREHPFFCPNSA